MSITATMVPKNVIMEATETPGRVLEVMFARGCVSFARSFGLFPKDCRRLPPAAMSLDGRQIRGFRRANRWARRLSRFEFFIRCTAAL
jgi:hypothetical protein